MSLDSAIIHLEYGYALLRKEEDSDSNEGLDSVINSTVNKSDTPVAAVSCSSSSVPETKEEEEEQEGEEGEEEEEEEDTKIAWEVLDVNFIIPLFFLRYFSNFTYL